jgi:hypothetical protein
MNILPVSRQDDTAKKLENNVTMFHSFESKSCYLVYINQGVFHSQNQQEMSCLYNTHTHTHTHTHTYLYNFFIFWKNYMNTSVNPEMKHETSHT